MRNPYDRRQVSRYRLSPDVVDVIGFCTKDPSPMLRYMDLLKDYGQYWFVTITPYGRDIEPNVPDKRKVLDDFRRLSEITGINSIGWRYDPILINDKYTKEYHVDAFGRMAAYLEGYTETVVISFIDLYRKVIRNFPEAREVSGEDRLELGCRLIEIAAQHGMTLKPCAEGDELAPYGADCSGCMTVPVYEKAVGRRLIVPSRKPNRDTCACYLACDIGAYDTCRHMCRYCYANNDTASVRLNSRKHDPASPFLIGNYEKGDIVHDVPQRSWKDPQIDIFGLIQ